MKFDPTRSTSVGYWRFAAEYLVAAKAVRASSNRVIAPTMQLHGQAIELSLKAFLLKRGEELRVVEGMRHRLTELLGKARLRRLGTEIKLNRSDIRLVQLLDQNYSKHRFRYIVTGFTIFPNIEEIAELSERLVVGLEQYCTGNKKGLNRFTKSAA